MDVDEVFEEGHLVRDLGRVDLVAKRANPVKRLGPIQHMAGNVVEGAELMDIMDGDIKLRFMKMSLKHVFRTWFSAMT